MCVIVSLVRGLSFCEVLNQLRVCRCDTRDECFRGGINRVDNGFDRGSGMISIVGVKGRHLGGGMRGVVVCKFSEGEQLTPVIFLVITEGTEILFQDLVDSFCLAVALRMIRHRPISFHVTEIEEAPGELGDKL